MHDGSITFRIDLQLAVCFILFNLTRMGDLDNEFLLYASTISYLSTTLTFGGGLSTYILR